MFSELLHRIFRGRRVYLDHASITPVDEKVIRVMSSVMRSFSANPSSLYKEGIMAKKLLEESRKTAADFLTVHPDEIFFTASGTESNNIAISGLVRLGAKILKERSVSSAAGVVADAAGKKDRPHVITLSIEHPSVLEVIDDLKKNIEGGVDVTYVSVDESGVVDPKDIKKALRPETVLVTVMAANNEIGTIQPIVEIAKAIRSFRKAQDERYNITPASPGNGHIHPSLPFFHTDASQAAYMELRVPNLGIDALTLDGSKVYGPRGTGALYLRKGISIEPLMRGGGQEKGLRPGTENLPGIAGFAEALRLVVLKRDAEALRLSRMRDLLWKEIRSMTPDATLNGNLDRRLPDNLNICMPGTDAEFSVLRLDAKGIAISSVTSCRNDAEDPSSYVVESLGKKSCAASSLRITLGRHTTRRDIKFFLKKYRELFAKK